MLSTREHSIPPHGGALPGARLLFAARSWSAFFLLTPLYGCQWFRRNDFSRASITPHSPIRRGKRERERANERGGRLEEEVGRLAGVVTTPPFSSCTLRLSGHPVVPLRPFWVFFRLPPTPEAFHTQFPQPHNHCCRHDSG